MFKVNKLIEVEKEKIEINFVTQKETIYENGKSKNIDEFKTLSFFIDGNIDNELYSLSFDLNCKLEELLKIPKYETIDFRNYILDGETFFNINDNNGVKPEKFNIKITRYLKNKYVIYIDFIVEEKYSGIIEIDFDLDKYIDFKDVVN